MARWIIFALLALPVIETIAFVWVAGQIGFIPAIGLMALATLAGMSLLRRAGRTGLAQLRSSTSDGANFNGVVATAVAGILLVVPGFLTDILGILMLIPAMRRSLAPLFSRAMKTRQGSDTIDLAPTEWRQIPEKKLTPRRRRK